MKQIEAAKKARMRTQSKLSYRYGHWTCAPESVFQEVYDSYFEIYTNQNRNKL